MKYLRSILASSFLLALVGLFAAGCRELPSSPVVTVQPTAQDPALLGGIGDLLRGLLVKTLNLVGSVGGSLTNDRWKVTIPAGAVSGNATIALGVPRSGSDQCALEILPLTKNRFRTPVTLTIDCRNVPASQLKTYVMFWFNPTTGKWEEVPGSKVDVGRKTVSAPLWHFSRYAAGPRGGKAGW
jgi:hypothetical protein